METVRHELFGVAPLVDCVLGYIGSDSINYWLRSAAQDRQTLCIPRLFCCKNVSLSVETMCAIAAMKTSASFNHVLSHGQWQEHVALLSMWSSTQNFGLLIDVTPRAMLDMVVSGLGNCGANDIQKMKVLISKYPTLCCDTLFDNYEPCAKAKLSMLHHVTKKQNVSTHFLAKQVAFKASDELIRYCFNHRAAAFAATIRVGLLQHAEDAHRVSISTLKLLSDSNCILPIDRRTYCWAAFWRGQISTFDFFYDASQMDINDFYMSFGITCPILFERHVNMLSLTTLYNIVRLMKPSFFASTPCVLNALRQRCNAVQMPNDAVATQGLIQGNLLLLNELAHSQETIMWKFCFNQVLHHYAVPMQSLIFMFRHFPKVVLELRMIIFHQILKRHQTGHLCFCVQNGILERLKIDSRWNEPQIAAMWNIPIFHEIFNKEHLLHDALYFRNESAVLFLLKKGVRISAEILANYAPFLSQMGLSGVLSNLRSIDDAELCYYQMRGSAANELVRTLWEISPLTRTQLMRNDLFWHIAAKNTEAARFIWQKQVLTNHDFKIMVDSIPHNCKQHALRFLDSIHHDF